MQTTIKSALRDAAEFLRDNQVRDARFDAQLLLGKVLNKDLTFLIAHDDAFLDDAQFAEFYRLVKRRANGEPAQHLLGKQEFYLLEFEVNENVLIPRPETEFLVEAALEILRANDSRRSANDFAVAETAQPDFDFCEIGTGSGCIAVAILKNLPDARAAAIDISAAALQVARRNAEKHNVAARVRFIESDVFAALGASERFRLIVSNPPYIPETDSAMLQREVRDFEPHVALFGGADGLRVIEKLLREGSRFLLENGFLLFEIGFTQSARVEELIDPKVWRLVEIRRDLQGIPRTVVLQKQLTRD